MRSFWARIFWLFIVWSFFLLYTGEAAVPAGVIGCAVFFACLYVQDLFRDRQLLHCMAIIGSMLAAYLTSYLLHNAAFDGAGIGFALLIGTFLAWESVNRLPPRLSAACIAAAASGWLVLAAIWQYWLWLPLIILYIAVWTAYLIAYQHDRMESAEANARYEALLQEYRALKRHARSNEESARIEERTYIARTIHDSVGHKLTSLLMQLEMFRMSSEGEARLQAEQMKRLAQESLDETRSAVKALKEEEPGGIQALLRLIRNLEAESYMQIEFTVRHGALSVLLDNDQSIAAYRAIQEALTNAMRHGSSRRVSILLESPGGRIFRFIVSNDTASEQSRPVREGFGLTAMRDRMEKAGGALDIVHANNRFVVRGTFPIRIE